MNILAIDDNSIIRQLITMTLNRAGDMDSVNVETGQEALELAKTTRFDLVIMDWQMYPMGGCELLTAIRQLPNYQKTPIIVISADSEEKTKQIAKDHGATGWMVKPFNPEKLIEKIRKLAQS